LFLGGITLGPKQSPTASRGQASLCPMRYAMYALDGSGVLGPIISTFQLSSPPAGEDAPKGQVGVADNASVVRENLLTVILSLFFS
jgi:hypothetical protein